MVVDAFEKGETFDYQPGPRLYVLLLLPPFLTQESEWPNVNPADSIEELMLIAAAALLTYGLVTF